MRRFLAGITVTLLVAIAAAASSQQGSSHSFTPQAGFVPDSVTAVRIALAVWTPIYGRRQLDAQRPYVAQLEGEVWTVRGSLPSGTPGGVALIELSKRDARVLRVSHGR